MTRLHPDEGDVKAKIKKLLDKHGWWWFMPPASQFAKTGISDFLCLRDSVFMAIEAKSKVHNRKPTPNQIGFLESTAANGGFAFCVNEDNLRALEAWLAGFDNAKQFYAKGQEPPIEIGSLLINCTKELTEMFVAPQVKKANRAMQIVELKK